MRPLQLLGIYLLTLLAWSCKTTEKESQPGSGITYLDWQAMAQKIIGQAELTKGEEVLLVADPGKFDPLVPLLKDEITKAGAKYLGTVSIDSLQPAEWKTEFTNSFSQMGVEELPFFLSSVDLAIMMPGATPADNAYAAMQEVLNQGNGRTIHFHWAGAYDLNGNLMETDSARDEFYEKVLIETDYDLLAAKQLEFETAMRGGTVSVTTPAGTSIQFQIGDRQVTRQDGNASLARMNNAKVLIDREVELPAGAIRVAPVEETVEGVIVFPDSEWEGKTVKGLTMTFEKGKVVNVSADENLEAAKQELEAAGEAGKSFREFALGFNPLLAIPEENTWIPYYGYGAGVVRLSLGDNSELGGNVTGGYVRWNFFTDATVKVGDEVWVENGKLIR